MIALVDGYCGMVLDALNRLGIREETIVVWTVDHGDQMWEHELFLKFVMREASVHIPLLIDAPGIEPGTRAELAEHVDLLPTLCELVGAPIPETVQGRSLVPLLGTDPAPAGWRDAVFSQIGDVQMIRTASIAGAQATAAMLNVYGGEPGEFFDLATDPNEFYNRIADPSCADTVAELHARLRAWEAANQP
jgi:arylsulfatase A-like enzyme